MREKNHHVGFTYRELAFQVVLHLVVLVCYAVSSRNPAIMVSEFSYFIFYASVSALINYWLLPRYFYRKHYWEFFSIIFSLIIFAVAFEELVLEQLFFPDTRGAKFPGMFYSLISVLPVMTALTGFKFAWDALMKQREVDSLREAVEESELQFLKSQINPHFLFNNLNNLYAYAIEGSPKTPRIILELSSVLRYMLYECKEKFVPLSKEIDQLKHFCQLNELQIEERGQVTFAADEIEPGYQIAPLILVVFIENAFKHSQASQSDNIKISIHLRMTAAGELEFVCENSFGVQSNNDDLSRGIGLANVRKRLSLLYPGKHQLELEDGAGIYRVRLKMQLDKMDRQ